MQLPTDEEKNFVEFKQMKQKELNEIEHFMQIFNDWL
jgi:hypothetical protein